MHYEQKSVTEDAAKGVTDVVITYWSFTIQLLGLSILSLLKKKSTNIQNANKHIPLSVQQP